MEFGMIKELVNDVSACMFGGTLLQHVRANQNMNIILGRGFRL